MKFLVVTPLSIYQSPTRYWRRMWLWCCVLWRSEWILTNRGHLRWINDLIIKWKRHRYHRWWQLISLLFAVPDIKAPVITASFMWRAGWLLMNRGHMRWIYYWIIQLRRHRYHQWLKIVALLVNVLASKVPVITRSFSLPTLIVTCSAFVETTNTLWTWRDEYNIILWWCCVPVIFFVDGHQKVRAKFLAQQIQSCLIFITRNKIYFEIFVSI